MKMDASSYHNPLPRYHSTVEVAKYDSMPDITIIRRSQSSEKPSLSFTSSVKDMKMMIPPRLRHQESGAGETSSSRRGMVNLERELLKILQNKDLCCLFRSWCKQQMCEENLSFWVDVELFRKEKDGIELKEKADEIYNKYFGENPLYPLNIDSDLLNEIDEKRKNNEITIDFFANMQKHVFSLMENGCTARFLESDIFKNWKADDASLKKKRLGSILISTSIRLKGKDKGHLEVTQSRERLNIDRLFHLIDTNTDPKARAVGTI